MARTKPTPIKSAQKGNSGRKSGRERRRASTRGATESKQSIKRRLRFHSQSNENRSSSKKKSKTKGKASDYLPPELRQAGLLAQQSVAKGKCFGPFRGQICKTGKKPDENYSLICKIKGVDDATYFFYIHDADKEKCMWLQRMQSASSKTTHNMVAHKSAVGVCYESTCDIKPGEELLVLYDDTYGGKRYPAYVENIPVHFVPRVGKGELNVLPFDDKEGELSSQDIEQREEAEEEYEENNVTDDDDMSNMVEQDDSVDNDDDDDDDDDEDRNDDDDDNCDGDDKDGDHKNNDQQTKKNKSTGKTKKPKHVTKVTPSIKEIKCNEPENNTVLLKYQCAYCSAEFTSHDAGEKHVSSRECTSLVFTCEMGCGRSFDSCLSKLTHKCNGSPMCSICEMVMKSYKELLQHMKEKRNDESHKARSCTPIDHT